MATDQDLALAAKAAGKRRNEWDYDWLRDCGHAIARDMLWDPRRDDGAALRLLNELMLSLRHTGGTVIIRRLSDNREICHENYRGDIDKATRLAIFHAAVAIGKAMP